MQVTISPFRFNSAKASIVAKLLDAQFNASAIRKKEPRQLISIYTFAGLYKPFYMNYTSGYS